MRKNSSSAEIRLWLGFLAVAFMAGGSGGSGIVAKLPPSKYLKNLYFDNLVYRIETVEYLKRMVGADHIMSVSEDLRRSNKNSKLNVTRNPS